MSEPKPQLFLSHATWRNSANTRTTEIRQHLFKLLKDDWEVFVDKESLKPGDKWRPIIFNSLSNAQAGIILFDQTAIDESEWVRAEALILCFRRSIDPDFQLVPVLLDSLKPDNPGFKDYQPFQLGEISFQFDDCTKNVEAISQEIACRLAVEKARTMKPFTGWMRAFKVLLDNVNQAPVLIDAWNTLINETGAAAAVKQDDIEELRRAVVQLMHYSKPRETLSVISALRNELKPQKEETKNLINAKWVENETVEIVFGATRHPRNQVTLIYKTPEDVIQDMRFFERLCRRLVYENPNKQFIKKFSVNGAGGMSSVEIEAKIEDAIKANVGNKSYQIGTEKHYESVRTNLSNPENLWICFIPEVFANQQILQDLHINYPQVVFLVQVESEDIKNQFDAPGSKITTLMLDDDKVAEFDNLDADLDAIFQ